MAMRVFLAVGLATFVSAEPALAAPAPQLGRTALVERVSGTVLVKDRGDHGFQPLSGSQTIVHMGAVLDATSGHVRVRTATGNPHTFNDGVFWRGSFTLSQERRADGLTDLKLTGGNASACAAGASAAAAGVERQLWGDAHGHFATHGHNGSATVRGTKWVMEDRCDGTRTSVKRGMVKTDTEGGELVFHVAEGQVAQYNCDFTGLDPVSSDYCTAVYSSPSVGLWGAGLVNQGDASSYDLCLTDPTGEERCNTYALSEPDSAGLRSSIVICEADRGPGAYSLRWLIAGVQLGPPLAFNENAPPGQGCLTMP